MDGFLVAACLLGLGVMVSAIAGCGVPDTEPGPKSRADIIAKLRKMDDLYVWEIGPDYDRMTNALAKMDGSPFGGHYYWRNLLERIRAEERGDVPEPMPKSGLSAALDAGGIAAGATYLDIHATEHGSS